ncbi:MAG: RNA polymerase factor sigma-54 [Deltaproteobacteria bacterium]|nr:RNA polymerase factor sigma-54 [Deltaproteobacteria bacterium]
MALEIKPQLRQIQQLVMTPQLQQAIKLLQYNHLEMVDALELELRDNPLLEAISQEESISETDDPTRNDLNSLEDLVKEPEPSETDTFSLDWENYLENYGGDNLPVQRDHTERLPLESFASYSTNLFDHLIQQLYESHIEGTDRRIALELIGNIDENGFLDLDLAEAAGLLGVEVSDFERVLAEIQEFDPLGVAARDLRECLLIQARALDPPNHIAHRILEEAFPLFEHGKIDIMARKLKLSTSEIAEAARLISSFDPKPGRQFSNSDTVHVIPDIFIIKVGNDYSIVLNDDGMPRLRISSFYRRALHSQSCPSKAKDYIQEKIRGAMWLIKSIQQRQRTIYKVTNSIIKFQREFFDNGIDFLKPLILKDVADDIEMHESTISRVTTNKYVDTPRGIFELKYFFNSGIRQGADSIASESVKNHILRIVKSENPNRPASDKQIVDELAHDQIHIARRTVAKYRDLMGLPPSSKRKKKF